MRILVTPRSMTAQGLNALTELEPVRDLGWELRSGPAGRLPTEDELIQLIHGVDGWIAGVEKISNRVLAAADDLKVISRNGVGSDTIDEEAARVRNIKICLARGANSRGVAELALGLVLNCLREVIPANSALHLGTWDRTIGRELPDVTIGIIGFGAIGRTLAFLANSLGVRVVAYDPFVPIGSEVAANIVPLEQLFAVSDVISLHCPPSPDGSRIISRDNLSMMKHGAILINTARSSLVDGVAILDALKTGALRYYAVDAFETEPPELNELLRHPRTILTPHIGGYTTASNRRSSELAVQNLIAALQI